MKKILLIDDNPLLNKASIDRLKQHFEVDDVMYLRVASKSLRQSKYDLLIIDVMMPTQNLEIEKEMETGFEYYSKVVKPMKLNIPVVFWSRLSEDSFKSYFHNNREDNISFLSKSRGIEALIDEIKSHIG